MPMKLLRATENWRLATALESGCLAQDSSLKVMERDAWRRIPLFLMDNALTQMNTPFIPAEAPESSGQGWAASAAALGEIKCNALQVSRLQ